MCLQSIYNFVLLIFHIVILLFWSILYTHLSVCLGDANDASQQHGSFFEFYLKSHWHSTRWTCCYLCLLQYPHDYLLRCCWQDNVLNLCPPQGPRNELHCREGLEGAVWCCDCSGRQTQFLQWQEKVSVTLCQCCASFVPLGAALQAVTGRPCTICTHSVHTCLFDSCQ